DGRRVFIPYFPVHIIFCVDNLARSNTFSRGRRLRPIREETMRHWKTLLASVLFASAGLGTAALAQDAGSTAPPVTEFPRNETLIVNNPEPPATNPPMFNMWVSGNGAAWSNGLHQLALDTLWFIDPDAGLD